MWRTSCLPRVRGLISDMGISSDCGTGDGATASRDDGAHGDRTVTTPRRTHRGSQARAPVLADADAQRRRRQEWWRERPRCEGDGRHGRGVPGVAHATTPLRHPLRLAAQGAATGGCRHGALTPRQVAATRTVSARAQRPSGRRRSRRFAGLAAGGLEGGHVRARLVAPPVAPTPTELRPCRPGRRDADTGVRGHAIPPVRNRERARHPAGAIAHHRARRPLA